MVRQLEKSAFEKGYAEGFERGQRAVLLRCLQRRFGPLSHAARASFDAWPVERLGEIVDNFFTARSLVELGLEDGDPFVGL